MLLSEAIFIGVFLCVMGMFIRFLCKKAESIIKTHRIKNNLKDDEFDCYIVFIEVLFGFLAAFMIFAIPFACVTNIAWYAKLQLLKSLLVLIVPILIIINCFFFWYFKYTKHHPPK